MIWQIILIIVIILCYWLYSFYSYYKHLKCVPSPRVYPIVGSALHLGKVEDKLVTIKSIMTEFKSNIIRLHIGFRAFLLTSDYKMIEFLLSSQIILDKGLEYDFFDGWLGRGLFTSYGNRWRKQRKMITPTFHFQILEQFMDVFNSNGTILVNKIKRVIGNSSVDVFPILLLYTLDIICETAMGTSVNAQLEETSEYIKSISTMGNLIHKRTMNPFYHQNFIYKLTGLYQEEKAALKVLHGLTDAVLKKKRQQQHANTENDYINSDPDDLGRKKKMPFLDMLLQSTLDGKRLTDEEIRDEVSTFIAGGHDTTAIALSYALFSLANNPDVQQKAYEEMYNIFGNDKRRSCNSADLHEMKYLEQVIKETLRMYPPAPSIGRKALKDFTYNGITIPKMMTISIEIYLVHHDPDNFADPERFDPERFAYGKYDGKRPFCFIPFSAGPRNCVGQKFAMMEIKIALSTILRNFELRPATPRHNLKLAAATILKSLNGIKISFHDRNY